MNPRVVIDTNVLVACIGKRSPFRWLYDGVINGSWTVLISNSILHEYREILERKTTATVAENVCTMLCLLPTVEFVTPYFAWNLIGSAAEDNKFVDCALAGGADALITEDSHFAVLRNIEFPPLRVMNIQEWYQYIQNKE